MSVQSFVCDVIEFVFFNIMGHFLRFSRGGTLLFQSVMLIPLLVNVLIFVDGFPTVHNSSSSSALDLELNYSDLGSTLDDLAISSEEELDDEDSTLDYPPLQVHPFRLVDPSASHLTRPKSSDFLPSDSFTSTVRSQGYDGVYKGKSKRKSRRTVSNNDNGTFQQGDRPGSFNHEDKTLRHGKRFVQETESKTNKTKPNAEKLQQPEEESEVKIIGLSIDYGSDKRRVDYDDEGSPNILAGMEVKLTLYGKFKPNTYFAFSKFHVCDDPKNVGEKYLVRWHIFKNEKMSLL